MKEGKEF